MEKWKRVTEFPKYSISNHGRVRYDRANRIIAPSVNQYGVVCIGMMRDGKQYHRSLSRLVARAFLPHKLGAFNTPINLDGNRFNNHVENLAWRPRWFAVKYNRQFRSDEPYEYTIDQPLMNMKTGEISENSVACAQRYGLLEEDLVLSIVNRTVVWPLYQEFRIVEH